MSSAVPQQLPEENGNSHTPTEWGRRIQRGKRDKREVKIPLQQAPEFVEMSVKSRKPLEESLVRKGDAVLRELFCPWQENKDNKKPKIAGHGL